MKRLLGIIFFLCVLGSPAFAVCPATLQLKDNAGVTPTAKYTDDGSGNCMANIAVIDGGDVTKGTKTDAPATTPTSASAASEIALLKAAVNAVLLPPTLGSASGGLSKKRLSALSTTVTAIKSSAAGQLYMLHCGNSAASGSAFIQVFDVATAGGVTLGTTVPDYSFEVTAGSSSGFVESLVGVQFANGIQIAATTTATGSSALATLPNCNAAFN